MFENVCRAACACALSATLVFAAPQAQSKKTADFSRFVVMGDSLSAGVENFSLLDSQQPHGYGSLIADQAHAWLPLPLVPYPGAPNVLQLTSFGPPPVIQPAPGTLLFPRDNPLQQPFNISVPGITLADSLTMVPTLNPNAPPVQQWATIVLGFPSLLLGQAPTQLQTAVALRPTTIIEWLGNNDALVPALVGQLAGLTPIDQFTTNYDTVLKTLSSTGATVVTANIPDITEVPYFTSAQSIANQAGVPVSVVTGALGIGSGDYVRLSGLSTADAILSGTAKGPLPVDCPSPLAALTTSPIPCVLTAADATTLRTAITSYNNAIASESAKYGALMVDIHTLVDQISTNGYNIGTTTLTTNFLGGLFSLDGIHPTNTGYAIIANTFIDAMDNAVGTHMAQVNVPAIAAKDPLVFQ
ncbi:MAG TPA: SGNH/GDSL hydrolase family protein [Bryobacteraceae bacterium]|jgi:lysophospholipase L1-like esterase|nr:SGNH/GDSL hydrolase family protein [Bryobacteraceae bacterium]